ncbi:hypothetical protein Bca52824_062838 [Brassica carinata]|uniref:C2H2-type domain-containing protein n=1 Tax=Brassica carinata TaxID=52824 RepID=A0A8X7QED1_BRACI|nr:hypothetical protein Bca52824_062838 [Brassica carinata]
MSSSYNNTISSSSTQSFPLLAIGANNFNREETAMTMNQRPNSVSPPPRRLRNKPGNPSPDAEVIALTPEEIMATNRFQCEVCKNDFKENRISSFTRGHNLPFNLKQKSDEEVRRKVYVCPEPTCVYHDPSRALGDLTGIKKHYYRKHGEKKFKCEKCDKCYAVESDCKAHSKICGTKEYRCVCDTKFSRRDIYDTHRAFCDALGHNLNRSSSQKFEDFSPQSTYPNHGRTSFPVQYPSNQGLLARNDQNLMNQHGLINSNNNNNNLFNPGYFQANTQNLSDQTGAPPLFNHADNNVPPALLRGSSVAANNFGGNGNVNFQGQMNSLAATSGHQGRPGSSIFDHRFGNNLSMGGSDRRTLDFLGVNDRGGRNEPPLDLDMKFSDPNNPFGNV